MSTESSYPHIERRADGKVWLTGTQIKVIEVALDRIAQVLDPDDMRSRVEYLPYS
jgi:hypothetical protein